MVKCILPDVSPISMPLALNPHPTTQKTMTYQWLKNQAMVFINNMLIAADQKL